MRSKIHCSSEIKKYSLEFILNDMIYSYITVLSTNLKNALLEGINVSKSFTKDDEVHKNDGGGNNIFLDNVLLFQEDLKCDCGLEFGCEEDLFQYIINIPELEKGNIKLTCNNCEKTYLKNF